MPYKDYDDPRAVAYRQKRVDAVSKWRKNTKKKIIESMGGCCQICSYMKCDAGLDLHHIDPAKKEHGFGHIMARPRSLEIIIKELKKCVLLCSNCHRELHAGFAELPDHYKTLDEEMMRQLSERKISEFYTDKKTKEKRLKIDKPEPSDRRKVKLSDEKFLKLLFETYDGNNVEMSKAFEVSETSIRKRRKKIMTNLFNHVSESMDGNDSPYKINMPLLV